MDKKQNKVFIATSLDGYIADEQNGIDWLTSIPNPDQDDMGYLTFMTGIDALVMGRNTFETVMNFDIEWPYDKPVFVLSNSLNSIPEIYKDKAFLLKGDLKNILNYIHSQGHYQLYIDGGKMIQSFLNDDLIDQMIITTIPVLLGKGIPLFSNTSQQLHFKCIDTKIYLDYIVQSHFVRI